jgi:hypothetical protein
MDNQSRSLCFGCGHGCAQALLLQKGAVFSPLDLQYACNASRIRIEILSRIFRRRDWTAVLFTSLVFQMPECALAPNTAGNSPVRRSAGLLIKAQANSDQLWSIKCPVWLSFVNSNNNSPLSLLSLKR